MFMFLSINICHTLNITYVKEYKLKVAQNENQSFTHPHVSLQKWYLLWNAMMVGYLYLQIPHKSQYDSCLLSLLNSFYFCLWKIDFNLPIFT